MADIKRCDRCSKTYDNYNTTCSTNSKEINGLTTTNNDKNGKSWNNTLYDLCPNCSDELLKWLNEYKIIK